VGNNKKIKENKTELERKSSIINLPPSHQDEYGFLPWALLQVICLPLSFVL